MLAIFGFERLWKMLLIELQKLILGGIKVRIRNIETESSRNKRENIHSVGFAIITKIFEQEFFIGELLMKFKVI